MTKSALLLAAILMVSGCATGPTPEQLAAADHGPPPPANYRAMIMDELALQLSDPAPVIKVGEPGRGHIPTSWLYQSTLSFGWLVCGVHNSRNKFGGYTGWKFFLVLFKNEKITFSTLSGSRNLCNR